MTIQQEAKRIYIAEGRAAAISFWMQEFPEKDTLTCINEIDYLIESTAR